MGGSSEKLDRDQQILSRLSKIEHKVDSIEQTNAFALRAEEEKHFGTVKRIFKDSKRKAQVYLATDGVRGVQEIAAFLGMKRQNVSAALKALEEEGLLEIRDGTGGRTVWNKKSLDKSLRISRFLTGEFGLESSGKERRTPDRKKKKRIGTSSRSGRGEK
ncbi:MarR family transcriptional regulator [Cystobacter fuscus]|uniref:MarR family transcriptional regulator n=1 Tax=Cystobacter fuscus TaxID=43 RepID=UPI0037BF7AA8